MVCCQEESKPSPLTLLAQTCNSIGRDSTSSTPVKSKSVDETKTACVSRPRDSPSTSHDQPLTDIDKDTDTRLALSPYEAVVVTSSPSTTLVATARTASSEAVRRRPCRTPSPVKTSRTRSPSPTQHRCTDAKPDHVTKSSSLHDPDGLYAMQYLAAVAALQRQSTAVDAGLLPYLAAAQRLPVPIHPLSTGLPDRPSHCGGGSGGSLSPVSGRLKPGSCSDPCCSRCLQLSAVATASTRCAGCHPQLSTSSTSTSLAGHGAFAAALSALCRLPPPGTESSVVPGASTPTVHTCNWLHPGGAYCGHRFSTVDELMQHLYSHCATAVDPTPAAPDLHPVAAGSLFAPLAVLYGASSSSYPPLDYLPPVLPPPPVQLPSTSVSPPSLLRHQQGLAAAAAVAATRYHPYRVPPALLPPSAAPAAYPPSLAAYYGALCSMAPGSNGTVPAVRL